MPTRYTLTERQRRILQRLKMVKLLSSPEISRRTGIPLNEIYRARKGPLSAEEVVNVIKQSMGTPLEKQFLKDMRLWHIVRICQLAPTHDATEIFRILREEKAQTPSLQNAKTPGLDWIKRCIVKNQLRTRKELGEIYSKQRRKPDNNSLTREERQALITAADSDISTIVRSIVKKTGNTDTDAVRDAVTDVFWDAIRRIRIPPTASPAAATDQWFGFISAKATRRLILLKALTKLRKTSTQEKTSTFLNEITRSPIAEEETRASDIPPAIQKKLTMKEQEVWVMLANGTKPIEVARIFGLSRQRIHQIKEKIREAYKKR